MREPTDSPLTGKTVLITGAARGIGAATARALVSRGARVALVGIEPDRLAALAAELGASSSAYFEADVSDFSAVSRAIDSAAAHFGGLDIALSNAGIGHFATLSTVDPAHFARTIEVNFAGTWNVMRIALPHLLTSKGYFLANASLAAALAIPGMGAYSASKAAIESLCDTLRQEVKHHGVAVGVAYFCWIDTELVTKSEENPAFSYVRTQLPGIVRGTSPLSVAVAALLRGMERREARVVAPGKIRLLLALRWLLGPKLARDAAKYMPEVERRQPRR